MAPQTKLFFDLWKISFEQGAQLQRRQLELMTAMQLRLAESQTERVMDFWSAWWRSTLRARPAGRGGPSPT
jgi:hypothetical protein